MASSTSSGDDNKPELTLGFHRGAIDQTTITTQPPSKVMKRVTTILQEMGIQIQEESTFHYRCIRAGRRAADTDLGHDHDVAPPLQSQLAESSFSQSINQESDISVLSSYGTANEDIGGEIRFSVELTRLGGLNDTYSLDIRRLKGNLRSYKFIYDTIRNRAQLNL